MLREVPKGEEKTHGKNGKTVKCAEVQDNESTYSFQNCDSRQVLMFLYQGWYLNKEKEIFFNHIMYGKFWFNSNFFIQNLDASRTPPVPVAFAKEVFLFSSEIDTLSFFSESVIILFFNQRLSSAFDFSMSKGFSSNKSFYE